MTLAEIIVLLPSRNTVRGVMILGLVLITPAVRTLSKLYNGMF
jgi:hypothetical protein